jgi:S-adenosylmethionine decarboxylase
MYECDIDVLNDHSKIENIMLDGAKESKATIVQSCFHKFNPYGVSGVVVIAESHLTIHTWPEYGYAALDLFTCGGEISPWTAFEYISKKLKAKNYTTMELNRGTLKIPEKELTHKPL